MINEIKEEIYTDAELDNFFVNDVEYISTILRGSITSKDIFNIGVIKHISDVEISTYANNDFLVYDNSSYKWVNKTSADTLISLGITALASELNYSGVTTLGTAESSKVLTFDSSGISKLPDSLKLQFGTSSDMQLYHDGTDSFLTNAVGVLKIATETSGVPVQIGHSTSEVTVGQNLTVTGDLSVDSSVLKVDSSNNRVGIGTATPVKVLHVVDTTSDAEIARFEGGDGNISVNGGAKITFSRNAINYLTCTDIAGSLRLETGGAGNNRLTIDSSGNSTFTGDVILDNAKSLRLSELDSNGSNHISIKAPDSVASNVILTLPVDAGTLIGSGDTSSVVNTMLAGSITANKMNNEIFEDLEALGAPSSDGQFIVATGSGAFAYESANTAKTSLGLGTGDSPTFTSLTLSGQAAALAMNNQSITGLATPTADADAATKSYVDGVAQGLSAKDSVRAATTVDGTLASAFANSQVIDGVTLATGDRILLKNQTSGSENGVYTVNASGTPTRSVDFDSNAEVAKGAFIFVEEGTTNADAGFVLTTDGSITLDTTSLAFTQFSGAGNIAAGDALEKSGNTLSVKVDDSSIEVSSDALRVKATGITSAMLAGSIANSKLNQLTTANKVALSSLDLDGGTDIGADLVDADLVVVDDGAGGTNRKSALSRMKKYIFSAVSGDATASDSGTLSLDSSSITGQTAKGSIADNDLILIADSADSNNLKKMTKSTFVTGLGVASAIDDLSDVTITSAGSSEYLRYDGSAWVDSSLSIVDDTTPQLGGNLDPNGNSIAGHLKPSASDTYTLGSTSAEWADLYLGESSKIYFGNDQDIFLEHDPDKGLILDMTTDSGTYPQLSLKSAFATGAAGATLQFLSETSSPAAGDIIATISADSRNAAAGDHSYGDIRFRIEDTTTGSEAGGIYFYPSTDGFPSGNNVTETLKLLGNTSGHRIVDVVGHDGTNSGLKLDGTLVTSIASELNLLDGGTAVGSSITVVDADGIIINDAGTMKTIPASDLKTYVNAGSSANFASIGEHVLPSTADTYNLGSTSAEWANLYLGDSSKIYFGNDQDVYLEHDHNDGLRLALTSAGAYDPQFELYSNSTSFVGPRLKFNHDSSSPTSGDDIGKIEFWSAGSRLNAILAEVIDVANDVGRITLQAGPAVGGSQGLVVEGISGEFNKIKVNVTVHNGVDSGLHLGGTLVTSIASELNLLDGGTSATSTTLADADRVIVNDDGTMKQVALSDVKTYIGAGATAADDISVGDAAVTIATSAGNITLDAQGNDTDIIFKGTDGGSDTTFLTLDGSDGGTAIFNHDIQLDSDGGTIFFGDDQDVKLTHNHNNGLIIEMTSDTSYDPTLELKSAYTGSSGGPFINLNLDSSSPAVNDVIGGIKFYGNDSGGTQREFGKITCQTADISGAANHVSRITIGAQNANNLVANPPGLQIEGISGSSSKVKINIQPHNGTDSGLHLSGTLVTASAAEINKLDGVTTTTAELNLLDGATSATSTTLADADRVIVNDAGTMKQVALSDVKTYIGAGAADDLTIGDAAVTLATSAGNITIDAQGNDTDIIFKGTDGSADITMLTLDGSEAGDATFNRNVTVTGDIILDDGGSIKEAGGTAAITIDASGEVTKIGQDSPSDGQVLTWDNSNSKVVWSAAGGGGGGSLPPEVKAETTSSFTVSLTPSNASNFNSLEVIYAVSNGSTAVTATLPTAASIEGKKVHVKRLGTANVTVDGHSSETIDGSATFVLTTQYSSVTMISDGANWIII